MRYMIIVKATKDSEAGVMPEEKLIAVMATYHEELAKAGILLDTVLDGPFAEAKELIAGYTLIQVKSKEEAMEWSRRFPNPVGEGQDAEIEVRRLFELEDFGPGEAIDRFRELGVANEK